MASLDRLNSLAAKEAEAQLLECCGSARWASEVARRRPFSDHARLLEVADTVWWGLDRADWLEAFGCHPRIGEKASKRRQGRTARRWSDSEQSGVRVASAELLKQLAQANAEYERRFGYIFIVCATGKSADEMLALIRARLEHTPERELLIAAEEQRKIMHLRLSRLLTT